jgi:hypothetical protein
MHRSCEGRVVVADILVAECGGIHRLSVDPPLAPDRLESQLSFDQEGYWWVLDLGDVEIGFGPVVLSEELKWIVGPLIMIPAFLWEEDVPRDGPLEITLIVRPKVFASSFEREGKPRHRAVWSRYFTMTVKIFLLRLFSTSAISISTV